MTIHSGECFPDTANMLQGGSQLGNSRVKDSMSVVFPIIQLRGTHSGEWFPGTAHILRDDTQHDNRVSHNSMFSHTLEYISHLMPGYTSRFA